MNTLTPATQNFILHWGEMGERWGINRTIAQIQALLFVSPEPLSAEQISQTLSLARSTVSVGLRDLQYWGIINVVHKLGDRTDYFELVGDIWEMFRIIVDRRVQNEIEPTANILRETISKLDASDEDAHSKARLEELLDIIDSASRIYKEVQRVPTKTIIRMARMSDIVGKVLRLLPDK